MAEAPKETLELDNFNVVADARYLSFETAAAINRA